jgi:hypothetical protein
VVEAVAQPANPAAHAALETWWPALEPYGPGGALAMARASRSRPLRPALTAPGMALLAKPWPVRTRGRFTKEQCQITLERHEVTCPAGVTVRLTRAGRRAQASEPAA